MGKPNVPRICETCGAGFFAWPYEVRGGQGRFCSNRCRWQSLVVPIEDRFFDKVGRKTESGCILWAGGTDKDGYGMIWSLVENQNVRASHVSYELMVGPVGGLHILHRCDNPPCINPVHLFLGTEADNAADREKKRRGIFGETHHKAKLTEANVREIRADYAPGRGGILARRFGVAVNTIHGIVNHKIWTHVS